jgi:glycosyltransferase involved in cell wall biosynthesis
MDRYADGLLASLRRSASADGLDFTEARPAQAGRLPRSRRLRSYWSAYGRSVAHARSSRFALNHILDHAYGHLAYVLDRERTIVTCHDLFPLLRWRGAVRGLDRRWIPPLAAQASLSGLRRAAMIVTPSEATKDAVVERLQVDPARIHVIPYGVDPAFRPTDPREGPDLNPRSSFSDPAAAHVLVVSTGAAYKNHRAAVEVLGRIGKRANREVWVVRVGPPLPAAEQERACRYGVSGRILELGPLPPEELPSLYRHCDALLHASFYEGFGWPALEAMASGLPAVLSTWRSLVEVSGDSALAAEADDYDGLADALVRVLTDEKLAQTLRGRGLERARVFTWERAAQRTADLYRTVLREGERC